MRRLPRRPPRPPASSSPVAPPRVEVVEKVKELVRLAQEQGYLTYGDINDALPDHARLAGGTGRDLHQAAQSRDRDRGPGGGGPRQAARTGGGGGQDAAGHSGRSGADVSQADGPGAAADARAGSRDFQAHRRRRERSQADHLQLRLRRQGTHRPGRKADFRTAQGTLRPRHPGQEDREPRRAICKALRKLVKHVRDLDQQVDEKYAAWQNAADQGASATSC